MLIMKIESAHVFSKLWGLIEELCCTICACALEREFTQFKEFKEFKIGPTPDLKLFKH